MQSTFGRIETLMRAMQAQQRSIETSNHNIANANTPGYSRQRVDLMTSPPYTVPSFTRATNAGQIGTGVSVSAVQRVRDGFLDRQYRTQLEHLGDSSARSEVYRQIEVVFNEPNESGLSVFVERFWGSWQALVNRSGDMATRGYVVEEASNLAANFNRTRQQIESQRTDTVEKTRLQVLEINTIIQDVADLNVQIVAVQTVGQQPNDLSDTRDLLLDRLSKLIGTTTVISPEGAVNIYIDGKPLVDRNRTNALDTAIDPVTGDLDLIWAKDGSAAGGNGGSTLALMEMHNVEIPDVLTTLATLRDEIVNQVNAAHRAGYGLQDPPGAPADRDFFEVLPNGDMQVRAEILADPGKIAAASGGGEPGNGDNALAIANLRHVFSMAGGTATMGDFYNTLIARIGGKARQAISIEANQEALTYTIDRQRRELSEVSLDEEVANMVKFQHTYQAAARAMTVVDEMLDTIINRMGTFGR